MLQDYERLPELLQRQREALADQNGPVLDEISREIGELSQRIVNHALSFGRLDLEGKAQLKSLIERAQVEVSENLQLWQNALAKVQGARTQLRSTRRFYTSLQSPAQTGRRYSKTG